MVLSSEESLLIMCKRYWMLWATVLCIVVSASDKKDTIVGRTCIQQRSSCCPDPRNPGVPWVFRFSPSTCVDIPVARVVIIRQQRQRDTSHQPIQVSEIELTYCSK